MTAEQFHVTEFHVDGHVAHILLNRPEAMNSLNPDLRWELSRRFDEVERNDEIWLAVVTGAGKRAFCAGADLKHRAREREATAEQRAEWARKAAETKSLTERFTSRNRSSRGSTVSRWAAAWNWPWRATSSSPPTTPSLAFRSRVGD